MEKVFRGHIPPGTKIWYISQEEYEKIRLVDSSSIPAKEKSSKQESYRVL